MGGTGARLPGLDPLNGVLTLPLGLAGVVGVLLVAALFIGSMRERRPMLALAAGLVVIAATGAVTIMALLSRPYADPRMLNARIADLNRSVLPLSPLACLVGISGAVVESACEAKLFAEPDSVASALTFVEAQIGLLGEARGASDEKALTVLRRSVETDRYGLVAQVFAARWGCVDERCEALSILRDPGPVKAHLRSRKYDALVNRYAAGWQVPSPILSSRSPASPALPPSDHAAGPPRVPEATSAPSADPAVPTANAGTGIDFPSAASIPPISIMSAEPPAPKPPAAPEAERPEPGTVAAGGNGARKSPPARRPEPTARAPASLPPPLDLQQGGPAR